MSHTITITLDGHATENFVPALSLADGEQHTRDEALRADLASGVSSFIGENFGAEDFEGKIVVTWRNDAGDEVIYET